MPKVPEVPEGRCQSAGAKVLVLVLVPVPVHGLAFFTMLVAIVIAWMIAHDQTQHRHQPVGTLGTSGTLGTYVFSSSIQDTAITTARFPKENRRRPLAGPLLLPSGGRVTVPNLVRASALEEFVMNRSLVAIPLLAAIWVASPAPASAQDPDPEPRIAQPRTAVPRPRPAEPRASEPREPRVVRAPVAAPAPASSPAPTTTEADDRRGRDRGGRGGGRDNGRGNPRDYGRDNGRDRDNGRGSPRIAIARPPNVPVYSSSYYNRPRYYPPAYYDNWARRTYRFSPLRFAPWSLIYGSVGLANYGYYSYGSSSGYGSYGYGGPYAYGQFGHYGPFGRATTFDTGSVRLRIRPRDAQVFVDGYFAGYVDDFDGNFQSLRLEQGGHKLEVRMPGYQPLVLDIHIQPNRTLTIREDLIP